jgi:hypothetical protein
VPSPDYVAELSPLVRTRSKRLGLDLLPYSRIYGLVKTTIDLPDDILEKTKIAAVMRRTSIKNLVIQGLELVLREEIASPPPTDALARLRKGYHLGGQPLTRDQVHAR